MQIRSGQKYVLDTPQEKRAWEDNRSHATSSQLPE